MARIAGVNLPQEKRIVIALTYIFGIGAKSSIKILETSQISADKRTHQLSEEEINRLRDIIEKTHKVEGDLRREVLFNIKQLKEIKSYRGIRHVKKLPVRGQRTKTNTRTVRGNVKHTMGSGRKNANQKT
ncbi:30S ribosomal protein S13 [Candidatus Parcubacteria bacterium]|nr:30S ribosomal protein S13 [Candidatus Parcubacteria bacterium]